MKNKLYNLVVKLDRALDNIEAVQTDILNLKDEIKGILDDAVIQEQETNPLMVRSADMRRKC